MNTDFAKTITILALVSLLTTGSAQAQRHNGERDWQKGPPSAEAKLARIKAALDLSDEQSVEMLLVLQQQAAYRADLHEQAMELMKPEICAQKAASEEAILAILTAEQAERYTQMKDERKANKGRKDHGGNSRMEPDCTG